jgi:hypothetical protein
VPDLSNRVQRLYEQARVQSKRGHSLWPEPYCHDSLGSLKAFVLECCRTFDDETTQVEKVPDYPHVHLFIEAWYHSRQTGGILIVEKSRRLMVSWLATHCELWAMGLKIETRKLVGLTFPKSAEHVWRIAFTYRTLREEFKEWGLENCTTRDGNYLAKDIKVTILPNGSQMIAVNQESDTLQGSGATGVRLEEASLYKLPSQMIGQARTVTKGRADVKGGHVVVITNSDPNPDWKEAKRVVDVGYNNDPSWIPVLQTMDMSRGM